MEKVKILNNNPAHIILFNAIAESASDGDIIKMFNIQTQGDDTVVELDVRINNIPIDFMKSLEKAIQIHLDRNSEYVKKQAIELLTQNGLGELYNDIQNAEWKIREALDAIK